MPLIYLIYLTLNPELKNVPFKYPNFTWLTCLNIVGLIQLLSDWVTHFELKFDPCSSAHWFVELSYQNNGVSKHELSHPCEFRERMVPVYEYRWFGYLWAWEGGTPVFHFYKVCMSFCLTLFVFKGSKLFASTGIRYASVM